MSIPVDLGGNDLHINNLYTGATAPGQQGTLFQAGGVTPVTNSPTANSTGPGVMGVSGVPQGGGDNASGLYTGNTVTSTGYGKFITGIDNSGNLLQRSLTTLSQSSDGRSLPGLPGGDIPPFTLLPYYSIIAAPSPIGLPTLAFGNMVAPNNEKWWFFVHQNNGDFAIGTTPDAWVGTGGATAGAPIYSQIFLRDGIIPTLTEFTTPISVSTLSAYGSLISNGSVPINNSTITLGGTVITFVTGTPSGNQVKIAATAQLTLTNLYTFLHSSADVNLVKCSYFPDGNTIIYIEYGDLTTTGNSFTLAASTSPASNYTISAATLSGAGGNAQTITGNVTLTGTSSIIVGGNLTLSGSFINPANFLQAITVGASSPSTNGVVNIAAPDFSVKSALSIRHSAALTYGFDWNVDFTNGLLKLDVVNAGTPTNSFLINRTTGNVSFNIPFISKGYTVSTLPTGVVGARVHVTDSNTTFTAGIGAIVVGSGSNIVPVFYDGTNWRIG